MSTHPLRAQLAREIRRIRKEKFPGLSIEAFAAAHRVPFGTWLNWEQTNPSRGMYTVQTLLDAAEVLGMELKIEFVEKLDGN